MTLAHTTVPMPQPTHACLGHASKGHACTGDMQYAACAQHMSDVAHHTSEGGTLPLGDACSACDRLNALETGSGAWHYHRTLTRDMEVDMDFEGRIAPNISPMPVSRAAETPYGTRTVGQSSRQRRRCMATASRQHRDSIASSVTKSGTPSPAPRPPPE